MNSAGFVGVRGLALLLAFLALVVYGATARLARPWTIAGPSMQPTLQPGDRILVDLWTYEHRDPRPGEIVLFRTAADASTSMVKRVVASPPGFDRRSRAIWVLGDNRSSSLDSRQVGPVARERLIGRVVLRYWPPSRAGSAGFRLPEQRRSPSLD